MEVENIIRELYQRRGYLVVASFTLRKFGPQEMYTSMEGTEHTLPQPFAIVSETNYADWEAQKKVIEYLTGNPVPSDPDNYIYFYRMTTD